MTISITKIEHFELINDSANPKPQSFTPYDHKMSSFPLSHHWYNRALTSPKFYWKQLRFGRFKIFRTPDVQSLICIRCHVCNKPFRSQSKVLRHISQEHKDEKAYKCETCTSAFKLKTSLNKHVKSKYTIFLF